ncbi:MAG: T9SS type A sorting domain-containing protein [Prolixibacteraceae bacterium]
MKKSIQYSISIISLAVFVFLFVAEQQHTTPKKLDKSFKTPSEMKAETISMKLERRTKGWAKPDQPSEFINFYNRIRTKAGQSHPGYRANYKMLALEKAKLKKGNLKSQEANLNWVERGPGNVSGRTRALIIDKDDPTRNTWLAGSVGGGIWKTTDAGKSWLNLSPDFPTLATVCLAQSASNTQVIYAGTGEGFYNSDAIVGDGIFKSTNKGKTWTQLPATASNEDFNYVNRIIVDPLNENILLAVTNTSIQKSTNGGTSWTNVHDDFRRIQHIVAHPTNFNIQFASAFQKGVLKSTDAGNHWKYILDDNSGRIELAIAPSNPSIIYALNENSQLFVSNDTGENWAPAKITSGTKDLFLSAQGWYNNSLAVHPDNPNLLIIGGVNIYKVEITGTSTTTSTSVKVSTENIDGFMTFINHGGDYLDGGMEVNTAKTNYTKIEVQFGPGKSQKAHRFRVPDGATAGVASKDYTYLDYVDVPFEVWDVGNKRQLMVSFRDQDLSKTFNLTPLDDIALIGREYIWINDVNYVSSPSSLIAKSGGHVYGEIAFWWPVLSAGANWEPSKLPDSKIIISRSEIFTTNLKSSKIADWSGSGAPYVHADNHQVQFTITNSGTTRIIVANDGGVGYSDNIGVSWTNPSNGYNTTQFYGVDKHPLLNQYIGGMQDNGSWLSSVNPNYLSNWEESTGGDGFDAVWHATNPNKLITSTYFNTLYQSYDQGKTWGSISGGISDEGSGKAPFITQIGYSPIDPDKLYIVGKSGVTISEDFGQTWNISPIPDSDWGWAGDAYCEPSHANPLVVWAASQMSTQGHVMVSVDGGKTYSATKDYFEEMGVLSGLATHPFNDSIAYALFSYAGYPKILRTLNMGQTWEDLSGFETDESTNGFPDVAVYSLLVMPHNPKEIWVGTEIGLFISTDNGENWTLANNGLPAVSIWEIKIRGTQVLLATHGRGVWTVDLPEIADALKAPVLLTVGTTPLNEQRMNVQWGSGYDSVSVLIDGTFAFNINGNNIVGGEFSYPLNMTLNEGIHRLKLTAFKNEYRLNSIEKSFLVIAYDMAVSEYANDFSQASADFIGEGFSVTESGSIGRSIQTAHPYPDNKNLSYYLKMPIVVGLAGENLASTLTYRDIPCVEEGESGSVYGSSNFYDYVIVEGSNNGLEWIPLLDGYDYKTIKLKATTMGKTIDSYPSASMFVEHVINLNEKFAFGDTIVLRFRLFSDANTNGWGWLIDDIAIQPNQKTEVSEKLATVNSIYPVPCSTELNVLLRGEFEHQSEITVFNLQGKSVMHTSLQHQTKFQLNTSDLPPAWYLLEIKSGRQVERRKFQVIK